MVTVSAHTRTHTCTDHLTMHAHTLRMYLWLCEGHSAGALPHVHGGIMVGSWWDGPKIESEVRRCQNWKRTTSMGRLSLETRSKVIVMWRNGYWVSEIKERLQEFNSTSFVVNQKWKPRPSIFGHDHYRFIDKAMKVNNKLTFRQLFSLFTAKYPEIQVSVGTFKWARRHLGWISKMVQYCAHIQKASRDKRLLWCQQWVEQNDLELNDVIFSDESSVQPQDRTAISTLWETNTPSKSTRSGWDFCSGCNLGGYFYLNYECYMLHWYFRWIISVMDARDSMSALFRSFPSTCAIVKLNLIKRSLNCCTLTGTESRVLDERRGTNSLWSVSTLNFVPNR